MRPSTELNNDLNALLNLASQFPVTHNLTSFNYPWAVFHSRQILDEVQANDACRLLSTLWVVSPFSIHILRQSQFMFSQVTRHFISNTYWDSSKRKVVGPLVADVLKFVSGKQDWRATVFTDAVFHIHSILDFKAPE